MKTLLTIAAMWCGARGDHARLAGRYSEAERRVRRGLALARLAGAYDGTLGVRLLNSLGMIYKYEERFACSARAYQRALRLARRHVHANHPTFAGLYHNMAGLEHACARYDVAELLARHGLAIRERALGPDHPDVARDLAALAAILDGVGRSAEAEAMHRRALEIFGRRGRAERREVAYTMGNLAACLHLLGRRDEAIEVAREGARLQIRVLGAGHPDVRLTMANLAVVEGNRKGRRTRTPPPDSARLRGYFEPK